MIKFKLFKKSLTPIFQNASVGSSRDGNEHGKPDDADEPPTNGNDDEPDESPSGLRRAVGRLS